MISTTQQVVLFFTEYGGGIKGIQCIQKTIPFKKNSEKYSSLTIKYIKRRDFVMVARRLLTNKYYNQLHQSIH